MQFQITNQEIKLESLRRAILRDVSGAFVSFEGLVRNNNDGRPVNGLEYSSYIPLAEKEGMRILSEAKERYSIEAAACVHRIGSLKIGEIAVWVGVPLFRRKDSRGKSGLNFWQQAGIRTFATAPTDEKFHP